VPGRFRRAAAKRPRRLRGCVCGDRRNRHR
jgi:hypothetical protein